MDRPSFHGRDWLDWSPTNLQQRQFKIHGVAPRRGLHPRFIHAFVVFAAVILISVHVFLWRSLESSSGGGVVGVVPKEDRAPFDQTLLRKGNRGGEAGASVKDLPATSTIEMRAHAMSLSEALGHTVAPLRDVDREMYTIRINTWRRPDQLALSIDQHAKCDGVAQIQVVWCDNETEPPEEVVNHQSGKVVIERHEVNSLNERFNILLPPPTLGILSMDDDVYRPCEAIDDGFFKWTQNPHRMVGFDTRLHIESEPQWKYGYLSESLKQNRYSISLPRYCFLHRDYLDLYMTALPRTIFDMVTEHLNCEDIAMSFFVSSMTGGEPPLLANYWSVNMLVKLYSESGISDTKGHKKIRDACVDNFADELGLKSGKARIKTAKRYNKNMFAFGAKADASSSSLTPEQMVPRQKALAEQVRAWAKMPAKKAISELGKMKASAMLPAVVAGMVEETKQWEDKWLDAYRKSVAS